MEHPAQPEGSSVVRNVPSKRLSCFKPLLDNFFLVTVLISESSWQLGLAEVLTVAFLYLLFTGEA